MLHTVFIQFPRRKLLSKMVLGGVQYQVITIGAPRFFGLARRAVDGQVIQVTDRAKSVLDAADWPDLSGGILQLAQALRGHWGDWFRRGRLVGEQHQPHAPLWVRLTKADHHRYCGAAPLTPDLILEADAPTALGLSPEHIRQQVQAGTLLTYRIWHNHVWRWYVQRPPQPSPNPIAN